MADRLIDAYDAALFDLDGVVYLGPAPVEGAAEGIAALRADGTKVGFVTNNAARGPESVAQHLIDLGVPCDPADVVTSAQAGARLLADQFPQRGPVLIVGTEALAAEVTAYGFTVTRSADDRPVAVIQGYDPALSWTVLDEAGFAIQAGAAWIATNTDSTRPTDRGLVPGNGAAVQALQTACPITPQVAGKPFRPLMEETVRRLGADRPIFVGDRLDTDIAGAVSTGMDSLFVFTGAHGPTELLAATAADRPTHAGLDLRALLDPPRTAEAGAAEVRCGEAIAREDNGRASVDGDGLDALWALAHLVWRAADRGTSLDHAAALDQVQASLRPVEDVR